MTSQIKYKLVKNLYDAIHSKVNTGSFSDFAGSFYLLPRKENNVRLRVRLPHGTSINSDDMHNVEKELVDTKTIKSIKFYDVWEPCIQLELDLMRFIKDVLDSDPTKITHEDSPKKVVVEFSSPNIAKPFHVGHLRSTIIGNSLANIKNKFGNNVVRINYLGDWGTQFGLIQLGMNLEKYSEEDLQKNPLQTLLKAYVKGNAEAEKNLELYEQAKKIFRDLESEKEEISQLWMKYRNWTVDELSAVYERLGISFDEYNWESDYNRKKASSVLQLLEDKGILSEDEKGRKVVIIGEKKIPLLKSDDTTLYVLRDLVAAAERRKKHSFDEMYYVVENGQSEHFHSLFLLCSELNINEGVKLEHVKFGKVQGMSTRKGTFVLLSDVLNEAKERIYELQKKSENTKVSLESKDSADILGVSGVIVCDLQYKRLRDYQFSWDKILHFKGNSGLWLQYCHSRLCNLEIGSGCVAATECDPETLLEPEALDLILMIAKYEETLHGFNKKLEPCILVLYLFDLVKAVNSAYSKLNLKYCDKHLGSQRLLLFNKSKAVLNEGMRLVGIKPLDKM